MSQDNGHGLKDSGERVTLASGMMKEPSNDRGRHDLISPLAMTRLAIHLERGAIKYSPNNWTKGGPFSIFVNSAMRHMNDYRSGCRKEDHLAAILFQIVALIHLDEMVKLGKLPAELDDIPRYLED